MTDWQGELAANLARRHTDGLYRRRNVVESRQGPAISVDGHRLLNFCSNDYLGLAADPRLTEALRDGAAHYGVGSGAAHLVCGHSAAHHALEEELAAFTGRHRALLFSTGYMANLAVISALVGRGDSVFEDRLNHASLIDGGLLSQARFKRYAHADVAILRDQLTGGAGRKLVATDSVFSMDGDRAPLAALAQACADQQAILLVDDAHGMGVLGEGGRGSVQAAGLSQQQVPILMGTLGKALGTSGAFVAGSEVLIETLIQHARPYIYTTATPPAIAQASRAALRIVQDESWRRQRLNELVTRFRREAEGLGLSLVDSATPIQPVMAGSVARAQAWSAALQAAGILVTAIRPPTVPVGTARLRITFSALHTDAQLDQLLDALAHLPEVADAGD